MNRIALIVLGFAVAGCTRTDQAVIRKTLGMNHSWSCDDVAGKHCRWVDEKKEWPWVFDKEHWLPNCNGKPMPPDTLAAYRRGDSWSCDPDVTIAPSPFFGLGLMGAGTSTNLATGTMTSDPPWTSVFRIDRDCAPLDGVSFRGRDAWICSAGKP